MAQARYRLLFVCSGNTCRSPMAEQVMRRCLSEAGLAGSVEVASAGLRADRPGGEADPRAAAALRDHGYGDRHAGRQFEPDMFDRYDLIIALDTGHEELLRAAAPRGCSATKIAVLRSFDPAAAGALDVPDPIRGGVAGYELALHLIEAAMPGLLTAIRGRPGDTAGGPTGH
jgi:protein-tyrosine phosphatase